MITINIYGPEMWDSEKQEFLSPEIVGTYRFENSLLALSKWEFKHAKPYLNNQEKLTDDELLDYYVCMCEDESFKVEYLTPDVIKQIQEYIQAKHTATVINEPKKPPVNKRLAKEKPMTSEEIYAYAAIQGLDFSVVEKWELNRLLTLIRCIGILQNPNDNKKKRSTDAIMNDWDKINDERRKKFHTKG